MVQYFELQIQIEVHIDALTNVIGAVLLQEGKILASKSKKLNNVEINYLAHEQHLYAFVHT